MLEPSKMPLRFYRNASGAEPLRDWLKALDRADRLELGQHIERVQYRWPVGMPLCRAMGDGLWEVRARLPNATIARVFFCFQSGALILLHGFIKKTQKTPDDEIKIARRRKKEIEDGK